MLHYIYIWWSNTISLLKIILRCYIVNFYVNVYNKVLGKTFNIKLSLGCSMKRYLLLSFLYEISIVGILNKSWKIHTIETIWLTFTYCLTNVINVFHDIKMTWNFFLRITTHQQQLLIFMNANITSNMIERLTTHEVFTSNRSRKRDRMVVEEELNLQSKEIWRNRLTV